MRSEWPTVAGHGAAEDLSSETRTIEGMILAHERCRIGASPRELIEPARGPSDVLP